MKRVFGTTIFFAAIVLCSVTAHADFVNNGVSSDGKTLIAYDPDTVRVVRPNVVRYLDSMVNLEDTEAEDHVRQQITDLEVNCSDMSYRMFKHKVIKYSGKTVEKKGNKKRYSFESGTMGYSAASRVCSNVFK